MKKIVHVIIGLNVGGAELMLKRLVLNSQANGTCKHEVISLTDLGIIGHDLKEAGIPVHALHMKSALSLIIIFFKLKKILSILKPDVVQTWMYHADFLGGLAAKSLGIDKIIWGIRTTDVAQGGSRLTVILRSICAKLSYSIPRHIVCAAHVSKDMHITVGYDVSKMLVIPNGFELDKLVATEYDREKLRSEYNISPDTIVIGSVGRFNVVKNQRLFIEMSVELLKFKSDIKFLIVGRDNTWENKELISWIDEFGIRDKFILLGQRSDIAKCMKAMDIFCLHSKTEGFPNVLAEAMAMKLCCVTTDVGDCRYLIKSNFCVSVNELSQTMMTVVEDDILRVESGINNYNYIQNYSIEKYIDTISRLY